VKITDEARAGDDPRQLGFKFELEFDHATRFHNPRQPNANDGEVILVAVVRSHEFQLREEVAAVVENQARDPGPSPIPAALSFVTKGPPLELAHEGGLRAGEGVHIQVEVKLAGRDVGTVRPTDGLGAFEPMGLGIEDHIDRVIHDLDIDRLSGGNEGGGHRDNGQE